MRRRCKSDVEAALGSVFPAHHEHVIAGMPPREAAMWEFGSEAHVLYHLRAAGIRVVDNFRLGRFGRTCSGGVVDDKSRPLRFPACPILNTAAVL